jgi:hypothetical protein
VTTALLTIRSLFEGDTSVRVVAPTAALEDSRFLSPTEEAYPGVEAEVVEGDSFDVFDVPIATESAFTHFLDGAQRTWPAMYDGFAPICIAHTSAALLERRGREVLPPIEEWYLGDREAYVPSQSNKANKLAQLFGIVAVKVEDSATGAKMQDEIADAVSKRREDRETALAKKFTRGRLLLDGGFNVPVPDDVFAVGLVKSHRRQYFSSRQRVEKILNLKTGQRSSVFRREANTATGGHAYSFYLKLHDGPQQGPMYGLIRIELPPRQEMLKQASEIASWLMCERCPLSMPDARYDKLLYPIRLVEQHLKARQPSSAVIRGLVGI